MLSRRGFVAAGGSVALVAGSSASAAIRDGLDVLAGQLPGFSRAQFADLVDTVFTGESETGTYNFRLVAIEDGPDAPGLDQFRLLFRGSGANLPDGVYRISHEYNGRLHGQHLQIDATNDELPADIYYADFSLLT